MRTEGTLAPDTHEEAREAFEAAGPVAQRVVRETARAMAFDPEEYRERVTGAVVSTARDVLFSSRLRVHSGTRAEFDEWCADHDAYEVVEVGSPNVERVVWHPAPFVERVVAASYQDERDAAVEILRRQALGRVYRVELDGLDGAAATDTVAAERAEADSAAGERGADERGPDTDGSDR
ncbi:DUF5809 family protein [Salinigranum halophilum]|jgi:hypothetical protein|uniref:DUF5809 family protein n=1 Tax=Salinigranum halophilum TaxID=2565931 RepID=UPI0010A874DD|nr:DUF5809 family protein [Salinigranum halophilum]